MRAYTFLEQSIMRAVAEGMPWTRDYYANYCARLAPHDKEHAAPASGELSITGDFLVRLMTLGAQPNLLAESETQNGAMPENEFAEMLAERERASTDTGIAIAGVTVEGDVNFARKSFFRPLRLTSCRFTGDIHLHNSDLGTVDLSGSKFAALLAARSRINGNLILNEVSGPEEDGAYIDLPKSVIDGVIESRGGVFEAPGNKKTFSAFNAWSASFSNLSFDAINARGRLNFFQAFVTGWVTINRTTVVDAKGKFGSGTIVFARREIRDSVFLRQLSVEHAVSFYAMRIGGRLLIDGLEVKRGWSEQEDGQRLDQNPSLLLAQMRAEIDIHLQGISVSGQVDLSFAKTPVLHDDGAHWKKSSVVLDGFEYQRVIDLNLIERYSDDKSEQSDQALKQLQQRSSAAQRAASRYWRKWLLCQPKHDLYRDFKTQPWTQLARALRTEGNDTAARDILFEREQRRPWAPRIFARPIPPRPLTLNDAFSWLFRCATQTLLFVAQPLFWALAAIWRFFFEATVGYGYRPERSLVWLALMLMISVAVFASAYSNDVMAPTPGNVNLDASGPLQDFNAIVYAIDVFVPLVDLQMQKYWIAKSDSFANLWNWIAIVSGWVLTTIAVAGFSGALKRER